MAMETDYSAGEEVRHLHRWPGDSGVAASV